MSFIPTDHPIILRQPDLGDWIDAQFQRLAAHKDNTDNFRVAEIGLAGDEERYQAAKDRGCCGFEDIEVTHRKSRRRFRFGFNYGH